MFIHQGLGIGDFEAWGFETLRSQHLPSSWESHQDAGEQGSSVLLTRLDFRELCPASEGRGTDDNLLAPMPVAACSRLQLEWPASRATGQLRSSQDLDTATSPEEVPSVGGLPYGLRAQSGSHGTGHLTLAQEGTLGSGGHLERPQQLLGLKRWVWQKAQGRFLQMLIAARR